MVLDYQNFPMCVIVQMDYFKNAKIISQSTTALLT